MICGYPKWVDHSETAIYSIDAQPNGYRLLTGGGDNTVKIWNMLPILSVKHELNDNSELELDEKLNIQYLEALFDDASMKCQKLLANLSMHSSPVNCVRWNRLGTLFASASDEGTIYVWEYRGIKKGFAQEEDQQQTENWMPNKSLRGHKDNVFEVKWAADSKHLAS